MAVAMMSPLTDAALSGVIRSLVPLQALSGGLRALPVSLDRVQSSPTADSGAPSDASDRGVLARARVLSARLARVAVPERVTLEWLVTYAHADADLGTLAFMLASDESSLRATYDLACDAAAAVDRGRQALHHEAAMARTRLRHGVSLPSDATIQVRLRDATERADAARARCDALHAQMCRWGRERIERAAVAWQDAGR